MVYWLVSCYTVGVAAGPASAATECCQPSSGLESSGAAGIENEFFIDNILIKIKDYNERTIGGSSATYSPPSPPGLLSCRMVRAGAAAGAWSERGGGEEPL